jgi:hypothetical protein
MDKLEQLADVHDGLARLLRDLDRRFLLEVIRAAAGLELPSIIDIQERTPRVEVPQSRRRPRKLTVDLLLTVANETGKTILVCVFEVQLSWDPDKIYDWALAAAAFGAERRCEAKVFVLAPGPELRLKIRERLFPRTKPEPVAIEPDHIPLITDEDLARRWPREAVFCALAHARTSDPRERRVAGIRAAIVGIQTMATADFIRYTVLVWSLSPHDINEQAFEELRERGELDEKRFASLVEVGRGSTLWEEGRAEGHEEGRAEGFLAGRLHMLRQALVDVLDAREVELAPTAEQRIRTCDDLDLLERWYAAARELPRRGSGDTLFDA